MNTPNSPIAGAGRPTQVTAPLEGIRVVEVGQAVCAPLCARHLADLGADVIKVENPHGGDLARGYDAVVNGTSAYFAWANYGKRSVVLDLKGEEGTAGFVALVDTADVLVHNLGPGAMDRLGFDPVTLAARNPRLVNCGISGYGTDGPLKDRKAFDLLVQGEVGLMSITGTGDEVAKVGISIVDMCAAVYGLSAIQAALIQRTTTGVGTFIDLSLFDCIAEWMMAPAYHQIHTGRSPQREGARHNMMVPYGVYSTGPGTSVNFAVQTQAHWQLLCEEVLERPEMARAEGYATNADRVTNRGRLEPVIESLLANIGHDQVLSRLDGCGIPVGEVRDLAGFAAHPQLSERSRWFDIEVGAGSARALRAPFNLTSTAPTGKRVPALGEHTAEVLAELAPNQSAT